MRIEFFKAGDDAAEALEAPLAELERRFSSEQASREYLFALRWPEEFRCFRCGRAKAWPLASGRWECVGCGHRITYLKR